MKKNQDIQIHALSSKGEGIGKLDGLTVFVDGALPQEKVSVEITVQKQKYAKAKLLSILEPSSVRQEAPCPYFGQCGGCQIMHMSYEGQLAYKRQKVIDAMVRIGGMEAPDVQDCIGSPNPLHYRNKIQLPIVWDNQEKKMGLYRKATHEIIPIERCLIQSPLGEKVLHYVQKELRVTSVRYVLIKTSEKKNEALVTFVTDGRLQNSLKAFARKLLEDLPFVKGAVENINRRNDSVILSNRENLLAGRSYIFETLGTKTFKISSKSFFQVNPLQAENLYHYVLEKSDLQKSHVVMDAYCGVGTFSLFAADYANRVVGAEPVAAAIENAQENALLNNVENCDFHCVTAEKLIKKMEKIDLIYLNPPRKGCSLDLINKIKGKKPEKIIYISCDPATLARDVALLKEYRVQSIQPFDMFPQTSHVETVIELSL